MKSTWISLRFTRSVVLGDGELEPLAQRDVAGGVLVEQRVVEDRVQRADPASRGRPARPRRAAPRRDRGRHSARSVPAPSSASISTARPPSKRIRRPEIIAPEVNSGLVAANDAVDPLGVGGREHLLGGDVGHVDGPVDGLEPSAAPAAGRQQPDRQVGARPLEVERVEGKSVELLRRRDQRVDSGGPGGDRIGLVEPADVGDLLPQSRQGPASDRGRDARARPRPAWGRARSSSWSFAR